ncbi:MULTISPECIES: ubiquitin-like protein Pup [Actinomyces]|uniref:Prokaryotic ubiquitin-like protein Pup n=2 Tax=Actinomyces TaxID=1654 RepID=A0A1G9UEF2_9ACTO|nr:MULTISPECIES: ubiquitin-like protein Pup [Actinomyces]MBE6481069.1 ubiquitin-like protein Pup [Actinomyces ruminicola]PHP51983.1 ubiquitin-like protein Pup [Actinomyces ruminis]SDM57915.1 prokaryotic ubiquitin-like protein Pup [Actinomyces ruminicola]SDN65501.1 prokaryotic ubiquitin-like protein Pup [Actinomyces ruminicola]
MSLNEQIQPTPEPAVPDPAPAVGSGQTQTAGVDEILDEIDAVLETNAAAFVQGFVQKGGQ